jgi:ribulose-phosphate 3-epimerase
MIELSASMMCAQYGNLQLEVQSLEAGGIDSFHIDVMDGYFVDNYGMGFQDIQFIRGATAKPLEAHLMIGNPWHYLSTLPRGMFDVVYIHPEADRDVATTLCKIKATGALAGIALNPGTSLDYVRELLFIVDRVLVLTVNPGHSGRQFEGYVSRKIDTLLQIKDEYGFSVYWDGACTRERIFEYAPKGVKGFVLGTSVLFKKDSGYPAILGGLRSDLMSLSL